jgi:hypothetical protein
MTMLTPGDCGCGGSAGYGRGWQALGQGYAEIGPRLREAFRASSGASRQLVGTAVRVWQPVLSAWWRLLSGALPRPGGRCAVPETACPPRCVCRLALKAVHGETATGSVTVTNTDRQTRTFELVAETFRGAQGDTGVKPSVEPTSASLAPGQSVPVKLAVAASNAFAAGAVYESRVLVRGAYEQCVCLELQVEARAVPHCDVAQGAIPTRVRAHRWYDHFQCEELCFEPARPGEVPPKGTPTAAAAT